MGKRLGEMILPGELSTQFQSMYDDKWAVVRWKMKNQCVCDGFSPTRNQLNSSSCS